MAAMNQAEQRGFTLIEVIIGITVIALVTLVVTVGLGNLNRQTIDPWQQVRGVELGQSMLNEINAKRFDENTPTEGSGQRCSEGSGPACSLVLGPEEANRADYDDVDDYNGLTLSGAQITNAQGQQLLNVYRRYSVAVTVTYQTVNQLKNIEVLVTLPDDTELTFNSLRGNW